MRFGMDGLPRDLPLSEVERSALRDRVRAWRPTDGSRPPLWTAVIPGGVSFLLMLIWMPVLWGFHGPWRFAVVVSAVVVQFPLTLFLLRRAMWRYTCRAMAGAGYEVCPRCAYPMNGTPADTGQCPECGAGRIRTPD